MKFVCNGLHASSRSQELLLPSPQAFILLVFLQLLLKGHLRSWFEMCKPLDCSFLLLILFLIRIIAGDDEVCRNNLRCFTLVEVFQIIVIASYFIADFISVVRVSKCCSILLQLLCSWMHCTTAFRDFGFLSWQRLTSCAFEPGCHHIGHRFGFQRNKFYVLQLFLSCSLSPPTFLYCSSLFLSVCLSPYKRTIGFMIFSPSWNITNIQSTNARNWPSLATDDCFSKHEQNVELSSLKKMCWERMFFLAHEWEHVGQWWIAC